MEEEILSMDWTRIQDIDLIHLSDKELYPGETINIYSAILELPDHLCLMN